MKCMRNGKPLIFVMVLFSLALIFQHPAVAAKGDLDDDGRDDVIDNCIFTPNWTSLGTCFGKGSTGNTCTSDLQCDFQYPYTIFCQQSQENQDGDAAGDVCDECPTDRYKIAAGVCGCGIRDVDSDGDGTLDCEDHCPNDASKIFTGSCGCGNVDLDGGICSGTSGLPDTGQTVCYNNDSVLDPCPEPGEDFYGQDASYLINRPSYSKMDADGDTLGDTNPSWVMVRDNVTGLVWQVFETGDDMADLSDVHDPDNTYPWCRWINGEQRGLCQVDYTNGEADNTSEMLSMLNIVQFGNRSWRLPTVEELSVLVHNIDSNPMIHQYFPNVPENAIFWAATPAEQDENMAWTVHFGSGGVEPADLLNGYHVLAVSGDEMTRQDNFVHNMDGTVTDTNTGLMWRVEPADADNDGLADDLPFQEAIAWAESLDAAGFSDWRLPTRNELQSLVQYNAVFPAIDTAYFSGIHNDSTNPHIAYWSSTSLPDNPGQAFMVEFDTGVVDNTGKPLSLSARAVRGGSHDDGSQGITIAKPAQGEVVVVGAFDAQSDTDIFWSNGMLPPAEEVTIELSKDGGRTWYLIAEPGNNPMDAMVYDDGKASWRPTGESSVNCYLKISPVNQAYSHLAGIQGPFIVSGVNSKPKIGYRYTHSSNPYDPISQYFLTGTLGERGGDIALSYQGVWSISDGQSAALVDPDTGIVEDQGVTGWFEVANEFGGDYLYTRYLFFAGNISETTSEVEPNNDTGSAPTMAEGVFYRGDLNADYPDSTDVDYFLFDLPTSINYYFVNIGFVYRDESCGTMCTQYPANSLIEVINVATGELMASATTEEHQLFSLGLTGGQYGIRISGDFDFYNRYILSYMVDESNGYWINNEPPAQIVINDTYGTTATINNLTDSELYFFMVAAADAPQTLEFTLYPDSDAATYKITIRDGSNEIIGETSSMNQWPVSLTGVYGVGIYSVEITPVDSVDALNRYSFYLTEIDRELEIEPNNSSETANFLPLAIPLSGRTEDNGDLDFFSFTRDAPSYLNVSLFCPYSDKDFKITLFKGSVANPIDEISSTGGRNISLHMGLSGGTYFLQVSPQGEAEAVQYYTLLLQESLRSSLEIEANNTLRFANSIEEATPRTGRIYSDSDIDYFGFGLDPDAGDNGSVQISFASYSQTASYRVSIIDVNRVTLDTDVSSSGADIALSASVPAGNYYVRVESNGTVDPYTHYELEANSGDATISGLNAIVAIEVNGPWHEMTVGDPESGSQNLIATSYFANSVAGSHDPASFTWLSLDNAVAIVDADGVVTAVSEGTTTVIASHPDIFDVVGSFELVVGDVDPGLHDRGNLILVAGGGPDQSDNLYASTKYISERVYSRFKGRLFSDDDIFFLSPTELHDINGDGYNDDIVDDPGFNPTSSKFLDAVTLWAADSARKTEGPLYIYLIDHGGEDNYKFNTGDYLSAAQLKSVLNSFQDSTGRKVVVIIEACKSGTFISGEDPGNLVATDRNRVVVTSTDSGNTYMELDGRISFSQFFTDSLLTGDTIREAYDEAVGKLDDLEVPYSTMAPQIGVGVGADADQLILGGSFGIGSLFPEFLSVSEGTRNIAANSTQLFDAEIAGLDAIERVWALVKGPDYQVPEVGADFETPDVEQEVIDYQAIGPMHQGSSSNFKFNGDYAITCYAMNSNGNVSIAPQNLTLSVTGGSFMAGDVNGDIGVDLSDVIIALQEIAGLGTGLLVDNYPTSGADVDGDNKVGLPEVIEALQRSVQ